MNGGWEKLIWKESPMEESWIEKGFEPMLIWQRDGS
jgi:hypothetical protein